MEMKQRRSGKGQKPLQSTSVRKGINGHCTLLMGERRERIKSFQAHPLPTYSLYLISYHLSTIIC